MKCSQARKHISDYIDGLLDRSAADRIEAHLNSCRSCADVYAGMRSLVEEARNLDSVQPSEGVWLSIRKELIQKGREAETKRSPIGAMLGLVGSHRGLALASAALLVLMISTIIGYKGIPFLPDDPNDAIALANRHFEQAEKHYQIAIDSLTRHLPDYKAKLPPDLLAVFNENLEIIDQSIQVCRAAIREFPDNQATSALLMTCYKKKIELLNEIRTLAMQAG
jgi:hypothetical protein